MAIVAILSHTIYSITPTFHIYEMNQPMPIQLYFSHVWDSGLIFVPSLIPPHAQKGLKLAIETS